MHLLQLVILIKCGVIIVECSDRPIIGILAQELEDEDPYKKLNFTSYLAASYVKAVESSGARVVPVFIRRDPAYYEDVARKVNGFLFTGGSADLMSRDGVARSGKLVLDAVLKSNRGGTNLPILGVCQGFELLAVLSNDWQPILTVCHVENAALKLKFTPGFRSSSLYGDVSEDDLNTLRHSPSTSNHHSYCLTEKNLTRFDLNQWTVLSTSTSNDSLRFVSSMEWRRLPIAGVQFHPEKLPYEWNPKQANPHDFKSIHAARVFYDWLVNQSRRNNNTFPDSNEETNSLIYNYDPFFTGKQKGYNEQIYYFSDQPGITENSVHLSF